MKTKQLRLEELLKKYPQILHLESGSPQTLISGVSGVQCPTEGSLCFAANEKSALMLKHAKIGALLIPQKIKLSEMPEYPVLTSSQHSLAHALITQELIGRHPRCFTKPGRHPQAAIADSAQIGQEVTIEAGASIGERVIIGDHSHIGATAVLEDGAKIGQRTIIWPSVFVGYNCVIGDDCHIHPNTTIGSEGFGFAHDEKGRHHRIPQIGNVRIGNNVDIGANVTIDRATFDETHIGDGCIIDNMSHIGHNCTIGKGCVMAGGFVMGGSSHFGDFVLCGGQVTVTDHVSIVSGARFSAKTAITKNILEAGDYGGFPIQKLKDHIKTKAAMSKLHDMRLQLKALQKDNNNE